MAFSGTKNTRINDPALRKMRALMILQARVKGARLGELAETYRVSEHTIRNEIDYAKREGLVAGFEDRIINELIPAAITAFKAALDNGDVDVAREVLKGMGVLRAPSARPLLRPEPEASIQEDTLEFHITQRSKGGLRGTRENSGERQLPASSTAADDPRGFLQNTADDLAIIEATVVPLRGESGVPVHEERVDGTNDAQGPANEQPAASRSDEG